MKIELHRRPSDAGLLQGECDCLVLGVPAGQDAWGELARAFDQATGGLLSRLHASGEMAGKTGQTILLHDVVGVAARRVLLTGLGAGDQCDDRQFLKAARAAAKAVADSRAVSIVWLLEAAAGRPSPSHGQRLALSVRALREADYRFDRYRTVDRTPAPAREVRLFAPDGDAEAAACVARAVAVANGTDLARDLGNTPANICTPRYLAEISTDLGETWQLGVEVFEQAQIEDLGMQAFLAVARGSAEPPRLIVVRYNGGDDAQAPVALVGKGVTFDSGGISIKPAAAMDEMKYDMCGAASVLGTLRACAELKLKINLVGIVVACENMPSGNALKPGDVIRSLSGKTIEVLNTDAEGRLILCDALTYAQQRFAPALTIDIATLTGACVIALGNVHSGLYANDDSLADALSQAGRRACDSVWRMPLDEDYQEQIKSSIADVANEGGRSAGSVTAACFLSRFVAGPWAHLDIAATAWKSGADKGGTGRPVPLLVQYLIDRCSARA